MAGFILASNGKVTKFRVYFLAVTGATRMSNPRVVWHSIAVVHRSRYTASDGRTLDFESRED
jgi:hypothetical protein